MRAGPAAIEDADRNDESPPSPFETLASLAPQDEVAGHEPRRLLSMRPS